MTEKSLPAMARMVPPFSVYGLKDLAWAIVSEVGGGEKRRSGGEEK